MHAMQAITPFVVAAGLGAILAFAPTKNMNVATDKIHDYSLNVIQIASQDSKRNLPVERVDDMTFVDPATR